MIGCSRRALASRDLWFGDYVRLVIERDVRELAALRHRERLPLLLRRLAAQTGQVLKVDLIVERGDGRVLAFEVKAAGRVQSADMRHLRKLRDALGERFLAGVALHTGPHAFCPENRLLALPIDRLWTI